MPRSRREDESYEDYKKRLKREAVILNAYLKHGTLFWNSTKDGTYRRMKNNQRGSNYED